MQQSFLKDNPTAPPIRFVRIKGRIVPIAGSRKVPKAGELIDDRLEEMRYEVKAAESSGRQYSASNNRSFGGFTTYPDYYRKMKFKNKLDFETTLNKRAGKRFDDLVEQTIEDLKDGYSTSHGRIPPSMKFRVMTRQTFDNTNIVFRRINGRVRPMRIDANDEVPF